MNNIVTYTDMVGRYAIALTDNNDRTIFNDFVTTEQYKSLINLLGTELYNELNVGLNIVLIADKWNDLKAGKIGYTDSYGCIRNWLGLKDMLIPLIYSKWLEYNRYQVARTGLIQFKHENAGNASEYGLKSVSYQAYNEYYAKYNEAYLFLYSNLTDYENLNSKIIVTKSIISKSSIL